MCSSVCTYSLITSMTSVVSTKSPGPGVHPCILRRTLVSLRSRAAAAAAAAAFVGDWACAWGANKHSCRSTLGTHTLLKRKSWLLLTQHP